jgi:hypothetical protein
MGGQFLTPRMQSRVHQRSLGNPSAFAAVAVVIGAILT